jgi:hypothetical protein
MAHKETGLSVVALRLLGPRRRAWVMRMRICRFSDPPMPVSKDQRCENKRLMRRSPSVDLPPIRAPESFRARPAPMTPIASLGQEDSPCQ